MKLVFLNNSSYDFVSFQFGYILLQGIVIHNKQLFFKMKNNYSSVKDYNSFFLVDEIIFKINIFLNKQTFQIYIIIIKIKIIKKLISLSQFKKKKFIFKEI